ncbi:MAG: adenine-specific methyltransferase EcoRI family protein, partial [Prevotella sp.]|nr:adenine-specific methyltransferase EcoRI family protein [Prevotella sp.]
EADFIITNPPFSLFREFLKWIIDGGKQFSVIGNMNAITYKEVFPLLKDNKIWLGPSISSGDREFGVPKEYPLNAAGWRIDEEGKHFIRVKGVRWYTNIEHGKRHEPLPLMTMADNLKFSRHKDLRLRKEYQHYDNYDAIEVPYTDAIPSDYDGVMGVPISFLDKYCPEQFRLLGITDRGNEYGIKTREYTPEDTPHFGDLNRRGAIMVDGELKSTYARILIQKITTP